jgi:hypothetical protein
MPTIHVTGLSEHEIEKFRQRAEQQDCSMAQFGRRSLRISANLWDADGKFDREKYDEFLDVEDGYTVSGNEKSVGGNQENSKDLIMRELSTSNPLDFDEIADRVIDNLIGDALNELQEEGKITYYANEGYVKDG